MTTPQRKSVTPFRDAWKSICHDARLKYGITMPKSMTCDIAKKNDIRDMQSIDMEFMCRLWAVLRSPPAASMSCFSFGKLPNNPPPLPPPGPSE